MKDWQPPAYTAAGAVAIKALEWVGGLLRGRDAHQEARDRIELESRRADDDYILRGFEQLVSFQQAQNIALAAQNVTLTERLVSLEEQITRLIEDNRSCEQHRERLVDTVTEMQGWVREQIERVATKDAELPRWPEAPG